MRWWPRQPGCSTTVTPSARSAARNRSADRGVANSVLLQTCEDPGRRRRGAGRDTGRGGPKGRAPAPARGRAGRGPRRRRARRRRPGGSRSRRARR
ncbi:hypothetical protein CP979_21290 [Streptomyces filamentosus]|nr:hypothetical protein CP979_21290 [Streptomyces filamentosus]